MSETQKHLDDIAQIRAIMERNTKFLSLSGLSGISAGICALVGAVAAWLYMNQSIDYIDAVVSRPPAEIMTFFILDAGLVMIFAVSFATYFSMRLAKQKGFEVWNKSAWHMLVNLFIPLAAGGLFCVIQLLHYSVLWVPSTMLLFYGMALMNAGKFTFPEIRYLGVSEIILGLACAIWVEGGLIFWAIGFG
ncbi:MAG: hypothetical protein AAF570_12015, partial [Bacteroidota bacterium]